jgi:nicotinamidase-related amidase/alkylated DNA repair dioxygenase AlkB
MSAPMLFSFPARGPFIQTRKALLLLDLQNDFVRPAGRLPVQNAQDFLDLIPALVQSFRRSGDVVWVRTQFEEPRPVIDPDNGGERIILAAGPLDTKSKKKKARRDQGSIENEDDTDPEAFLSGSNPACRAQSPGVQFPAPIVAAIDAQKDLVIVKSDYSALQSPGLVLSLRSRFVTELYLCGSLSNVSVYATALDAARQGFSLTLVEDCLGFRSFARHEEAIRRMADIMGANGVSVQEVLEEQEWQETREIARAGPRQGQAQGQRQTPVGIDGVMNHLAVQGSPPIRHVSIEAGPQAQGSAESFARPQRTSTPYANVVSPSAVLSSTAIEADSNSSDSDGEHGLLPLSKYPLPLPRPIRETHSGDTIHRAPARLRRPRRGPPDSPPSSRRPGSSRTAEAPSPSPVLTTTRATPPAPSSTAMTTATARKKKKSKSELLGPGDHIGEGDSRIVYNVNMPLDAFHNVYEEVQWQKMYHLSGQVPRLVAVQGAVLPDGSIPIYRHPADESPPLLPFTPTVDRIRQIVERMLGHSLNHALIQLYRNGQDRISEHSDKTLDIAHGTFICNVSLGTQRTMILRSKVSGTEQPSQEDDDHDSSTGAGRRTQRIPMPHESVFILGPTTNMRWQHGIRADKRPDAVKSAQEKAYNGERISLTFRSIATFIHPHRQTIWGQGAVAKGGPDTARPVIHGDPAETERLVRAFSRENRDVDFDWNAVYGRGFDVVNFVTPAVSRLVLSGDLIADLRVRISLAENGMRYEIDGTAPSDSQRPVYLSPDGQTSITGDIEILSYLAELDVTTRPGVDILRGGSRLQGIADLTQDWRQLLQDGQKHPAGWRTLLSWERRLQKQEQREGHHYISGAVFGVDDVALWPVLFDMLHQNAPVLSSIHCPYLWGYYHRIAKRGCVRAVLNEMEMDTEPE